MTIRTSGLASLLLLGTALASPALSQGSLSAVILRGAAASRGAAAPGSPAVLQPGVRVESPAGSWTELAFSDGTSIVLEAGADFTLQGLSNEAGRLVVQGAAGRGRLRISTSDGVDVLLRTPGGTVRVSAASAIVVAGREGSATLISGSVVSGRRGRVVVASEGREETLRRPGFAAAFGMGIQRRGRTELAALVDPFAPVAMGGEVVSGTDGGTDKEVGGLPVAAQRLTGLTANDGTAPTSSASGGTIPAVTNPTVTNPIVTDPIITEPIITNPRPRTSSTALSLALAGGLPPGPNASGLLAPAANSKSSSLDGTGNYVTQETQIGRLDGTGFSQSGFSTGRVRRFAPGTSSASAARPRVDTGTVNDGITGATPSGRFQNLTQTSLPTPPLTGSPVYDAVARVGVISLVVFEPTTQGNTATLYTTQSTPRVIVADASTPRVDFTRTFFPSGGSNPRGNGKD